MVPTHLDAKTADGCLLQLFSIGFTQRCSTFCFHLLLSVCVVIQAIDVSVVGVTDVD